MSFLEEEDLDVPDILEDIIELLLSGLRDTVCRGLFSSYLDASAYILSSLSTEVALSFLVVFPDYFLTGQVSFFELLLMYTPLLIYYSCRTLLCDGLLQKVLAALLHV